LSGREEVLYCGVPLLWERANYLEVELEKLGKLGFLLVVLLLVRSLYKMTTF
jgi:hypothetical protein